MKDLWANCTELVRSLNLALHGKKCSDDRLNKIFMAEALNMKPWEVDEMDEEDYLTAQWVIRRRNRMSKQRK